MGTNLWRKLTLEWPCALGDWLWQVFVVELADFLGRLTLKRTILLVALILFIVAIAYTQVFSLSDVFLLANEAVVYIDVVTAIMLLVIKGHVRQTLRAATRQAVAVAQGLSNILRRYRSEARQRRNANALRRERALKNPKPSDDEPVDLLWTGMSKVYA